MTRYREALHWLYGLESRGIKLGLDRIAKAAEMRGHPERETRFVHVAGTNGKGSVATMVESVLRAAGYRTGQFASPHLQRYVERVSIGGRPISEREAANRIEDLSADTRLPALSFFEYTTLLAFEAFLVRIIRRGFKPGHIAVFSRGRVFPDRESGQRNVLPAERAADLR